MSEPAPENVPIIILAGGKSSRMGRDKLALPVSNGKTMLESVADSFRQIFGRVYIAAGLRSDIDIGFPLINDIYPGCGPISGLHAALTALGEGVFLVAGDMPYAQAKAALGIIEQSIKNSAAAGVAVSESGIEPLFSYYSAGLLPLIEESINKEDYSLYRLLKTVWYTEFQVNQETVTNINTPEEYNLFIEE